MASKSTKLISGNGGTCITNCTDNVVVLQDPSFISFENVPDTKCRVGREVFVCYAHASGSITKSSLSPDLFLLTKNKRLARLCFYID